MYNIFRKRYIENFETKVEEPFDNFFVEVYNKVFEYPYLFEYDVKQIKKYLKEDAKILDAGTGVGRHYDALCKVGGMKNVIGIDKSGKMINKAKIRNAKSQLDIGDMVDSGLFGEKKFDIITCFQETIYHNNADKIETIMRNFYKWLKPGGLLMIHVFDVNKLDPAPRDHSQYYTDNHGIKHAITYMDGYIHDAWWDNGKYYQRVLLDDGSSKDILTLNLNMMSKDELLEKKMKAGFEIKDIIDYRGLDITQYELYVMEKKIKVNNI